MISRLRLEKWQVALIFITFCALVVRLWGISFGMPYVLDPDEAVLVNHAMAFGTGDLNPHYFIWPSLFMYLLFGIYGFTYALGRVFGWFSGTADFVRLFFSDVRPFYLPGRYISALSGTATVIVVFRMARRAHSIAAGLIAALFLSFAVQHVAFSHILKTHVLAGLFVALSVDQAIRILKDNSIKRYMLAGAFAGISASIVYHGGFVLISLLVAHVCVTGQGGWAKLRGVFSKRLLLACISCGFCFIAGTPFSVLDFGTFWKELRSIGIGRYLGGIWERGILYPFESLIQGMGILLGALAIAGILYALVSRKKEYLIIASQPLFLGLFLMLFRVKEPHHMLIAYPCLCVLGAVTLVDGYKWIKQKAGLREWALGATALAIMVVPIKSSIKASINLSLPDTRIIGKRWIEENIPRGAMILTDSGKYYIGSVAPPLQMSKGTLQRLIARGEKVTEEEIGKFEGSRLVGYKGEAEYFKMQLDSMKESDDGYNIILLIRGLPDQSNYPLTLEEYIRQGVEYVIISSGAYGLYEIGGEQDRLHAETARNYREFYQSLEQKADALKAFHPDSHSRGPTIKIFKLKAMVGDGTK
ncbi:MAG: glycosyltransferase family 39 protein [Planctomycetes bacterium]|nr:glycosyltransferase family 39 protein [Planctomycetota bacterium]